MGLLLILVSSCETKPDFIGKDLLPGSDDFFILFDSTTSFSGYTIYGDTVPTSNKTVQLLGSLIDPYFGYSRADLVTQFESNYSSKAFGDTVRIDSVILYLYHPNKNGDPESKQEVYVYEYTGGIGPDTIFYSNQDITGNFDPRLLGSGTMSGSDSITGIFITDTAYINRFLQADDSVLSSTYYLQKEFSGLYITTEPVLSGGTIFEVELYHDYSNLAFFYVEGEYDTLIQSYAIGDYSATYNMFYLDHSGYPVEEFVQNGSESDSLIFIQSMGGLNSIIHFENLATWIDSMPVAINEAILILPVADTILTQQSAQYFPDYFNLYMRGEDGKLSYIYDYQIYPEGFGGYYDPDNHCYSFSVKMHIQSLFSQTIKNVDLFIGASNTDETVRRVPLYCWSEDPNRRIRLEITYTSVQK